MIFMFLFIMLQFSSFELPILMEMPSPIVIIRAYAIDFTESKVKALIFDELDADGHKVYRYDTIPSVAKN